MKRKMSRYGRVVYGENGAREGGATIFARKDMEWLFLNIFILRMFLRFSSLKLSLERAFESIMKRKSEI
jgi:hypothetical protein